MSKIVRGYHFVGDTLRDGRPVPRNGVWLKHPGACLMCESGLHFSRHPFEALTYAPGPILCRVECRDIEEEWGDKLVCRERRIVARFDATDLLRRFARLCALDVVHLWGTPEVVIKYLKTGEEDLRAAARDAAWAAAGAASTAAAWAAAGAAAWDAAWAAAGGASTAAAWAAARAAAEAAVTEKQRRRFARMVNAEFKRKAA